MQVPAWRRYLRFWRHDIDADLDEEFRFHVDAEIEYLTARGWPPATAREEALRRFGDIEQSHRDCRSADQRRARREHRTEHLNVLKADLRFALRSLRRQPAFTAVAAITLALGIGATTAIFSVIHSVLLTPLPYRDPDRLVMLWETTQSGDRVLVSYRNFEDWRRRQRGFEDIAVYNPFPSFTMTGRGDAERVRGALVSGNYLSLIGVRPALGRMITASDDSSGAARVAVLGNSFFQTRFGGDPSVIGRTLVLDGDAYTVVGVLPPHLRISYRSGDENADVVLPVGLFTTDEVYNRESHPGLFGVGRLKPGVTVEQAVADLQRVSAELRAEYPKENAGIGSGGAPLMEIVVGRIKPALQILMAAVGLVLLIACANVANLVLSRSAARQREFALRTALGAARVRIVRQVLTESTVLAIAGGALGIGIAVAGVRLLGLLDQDSSPRLAESHVNAPVLLFALGVTLLTGVLFGLVPALQSGSTELVSSLKEGGRGTSGGVSRHRTRAALTVIEVALAVVLLAGSGLLVRSFAKLTAVDPGFEPSHLITGVVRLPAAKYPEVVQARIALDQLLAKVRAIPGVQRATLGSDLPINTNWQSSFSIASRPVADSGQEPLLNVAVIDPEYFETLKIPFVSGRRLESGDIAGRPLVAMVSERVAKQFFPGINPIGERVHLGGHSTDTTGWRTIVGVVRDTRTDGLSQDPRGTLYLPRAQEEMRGGWVIVRSGQPAELITAQLRHALAEVDPDVPLARVQTMDAALAAETREPKFSMLLLTIFAAVALALASVGIYGVVAYNVTQRTGEIGVRIALGAQRRNVLALVVGQAMGMAAAGVAIGLLLALWGGKSLSAMLFGVGPRDPLVLGAASVFLLVVAGAAALSPAIRAMRIDPTIAMRAE